MTKERTEAPTSARPLYCHVDQLIEGVIAVTPDLIKYVLNDVLTDCVAGCLRLSVPLLRQCGKIARDPGKAKRVRKARPGSGRLQAKAKSRQPRASQSLAELPIPELDARWCRSSAGTRHCRVHLIFARLRHRTVKMPSGVTSRENRFTQSAVNVRRGTGNPSSSTARD